MKSLCSPLLALTVIMCAIACAGKAVQPVAGRYDASGSDLEASDYVHVYASWTRHNRMYDGLENKVFVTGTFLTPEMRQAVRITYPDVIGRGGMVTRDELAGPPPSDVTFFISMYTADRKWNDLQTPTSIWRVSLQTATGEVKPSSVTRILKDQNLLTVFPTIGRSDECYLIRFPADAPNGAAMIGETTTNVGLRLASGVGSTTLDFSMIRGEAPVPTSGQPPFIPAVR